MVGPPVPAAAAPPEVWSALDLLEQKELVPIITFCRALDSALGCGGARRRSLTEICGKPNSGKSQLAMQLCVDAAIPVEFRGAGGKSIFVDCDGSFSVERLTQMAGALVAHVAKLAAKSTNPDKHRAARSFRVESVLASVSVVRALDDLDVMAVAELVAARLDAANDGVVLLVVDSAATHFRWSRTEADLPARPRLLARLAAQLAALALRHDLAVVTTNQLTTNLEQKALAPALGAAWAHVPDARILLDDHADTRVATVDKGFGPAPVTVHFSIDHRGVRDAKATR